MTKNLLRWQVGVDADMQGTLLAAFVQGADMSHPLDQPTCRYAERPLTAMLNHKNESRSYFNGRGRGLDFTLNGSAQERRNFSN
jgi:hypothetical protein